MISTGRARRAERKPNMSLATMYRISLLVVALVATSCFTQAFVPSNPILNVPSQSKTVHSMQQRQQYRRKHITLSLQNEKYTDIRTSSLPTTTLLRDGADLEDATATSVVKPNMMWGNEEDQGIYKTAIRRTLFWVAAAIGYGFLLIFVAGPETSGEFYAGYLLEQSLSIDNLLVFLLLFEYFKVPLEYQNRILNWGIIGSIVMRGTMIGVGAVALQEVREVLLIFAAILLFSSYKVIVGDDDDDDEDLSENAIVKFANNLFSSTDQFDGDNFFTEIDGIRKATPMLLCMIAVEISDVVFAVDSIPAIFGVTEVRFNWQFTAVEFSFQKNILGLTIFCPILSSLYLGSFGCVFIKHVRNYGTAESVHNFVQGCIGAQIP